MVPGTPIWSERARAGRRGVGGLTLGVDQPPAPPVSFTTFSRPRSDKPISTNSEHHAGPEGAADFHCLRQLPPPPKKL